MPETKSPVITLAQQLAAAGPAALFNLPLEDIAVVTDAANESLDDAIIFGARAELALRQMVDELCLDRLPLTVRELIAVLNYGHLLRTSGRGQRDSEEDEDYSLWVSIDDKSTGKYFPAFLPSVVAYRNGDKLLLQKINKHQLSVSQLARRVQPDASFQFFESKPS